MVKALRYASKQPARWRPVPTFPSRAIVNVSRRRSRGHTLWAQQACRYEGGRGSVMLGVGLPCEGAVAVAASGAVTGLTSAKEERRTNKKDKYVYKMKNNEKNVTYIE